MMDRTTLIVILAVVLLGFVWFRHRRAPRFTQPTLAYAYHAEALAEAGEDLRAAFGELPGDLPEGAVLMRFSLLNRSDGTLAATHFRGPVTVDLADGVRVLDAKPVESHGRASHEGISVSVDGRRIIIDPFALPSYGSVIFNVTADGPVGAPVVGGGLTDQGDPEILG